MPKTRIDLRYAAWLCLLVLLLALPAFGGFTGIGWEVSQIAGYLSAVACILLTGAPVRPRLSVPPALVSLGRHTLIGWSALGLVALHVGGLLLADRTVVEYLKPSAPLYQLAGIAAALALLLLVFGGLAAARRRLWRSHRGFQATHIVIAYAAVTLITVHVVVTARYLGGGGRRALFAGAAVSAVLMLLRARRPTGPPAGQPPALAPPAPGAGRARHPLAFGRHSVLIVAAAAICAAGIAALLPAGVDAALREPALRRSDGLALDFPHEKHGAVNCLTCHHNYADGRGMQACIECHRSARADLKEGVEARFHGFCLDCHRHPDAALHAHGPVAGCTVCHHRVNPGAAPGAPPSSDAPG
ncbi:MAG TPA: cytochrome c3 family protein [Steroidobacteraceae bacterium]|jgi:predicted CXXCH cytochrome family protein|nr:cytochrome c3 family protein [Steroidobacteraceae bacterium]